MPAQEIQSLIQLMSRLPGLGPRSARRAVLHLLTRRDSMLAPLQQALARVADGIKICHYCGNLDLHDPCAICADEKRDPALVCVVADIADLWAIERAGIFKGRYLVLGGTLSALDGRRPEDLNLDPLLKSVAGGAVREVILALSATLEGQSTAHYLCDRLVQITPETQPLTITRLARGLPIGGELDYMDEGTLAAALRSRHAASESRDSTMGEPIT